MLLLGIIGFFALLPTLAMIWIFKALTDPLSALDPNISAIIYLGIGVALALAYIILAIKLKRPYVRWAFPISAFFILVISLMIFSEIKYEAYPVEVAASLNPLITDTYDGYVAKTYLDSFYSQDDVTKEMRYQFNKKFYHMYYEKIFD